jgi:hypothetical protein
MQHSERPPKRRGLFLGQRDQFIDFRIRLVVDSASYVDKGTYGSERTLIMYAAALREFVRDNDLGLCVDRCLCVIGLDEAFLRLHDAAVRIGEVALRLGIRFVR